MALRFGGPYACHPLLCLPSCPDPNEPNKGKAMVRDKTCWCCEGALSRYEKHQDVKKQRAGADTATFYSQNYRVESWDALLELKFPKAPHAVPNVAKSAKTAAKGFLAKVAGI